MSGARSSSSNLLRRLLSKVSIFQQVAVLALAIGTVAWLSMGAARDTCSQALYKHEKTDLREETAVLARRIQNLTLLTQTLSVGLHDIAESPDKIKRLKQWLDSNKTVSEDGVIVAVEFVRANPEERFLVERQKWTDQWPYFIGVDKDKALHVGIEKDGKLIPALYGPATEVQPTGDSRKPANERQFECRFSSVATSAADPLFDDGIPVLTVVARLTEGASRDNYLRLTVDLRKLQLSTSPRSTVLLFNQRADGMPEASIFPRGIDVGEVFPDTLIRYANSVNAPDVVELPFTGIDASQRNLLQHYFVVGDFNWDRTTTDAAEAYRATELEAELLTWKENNSSFDARITQTSDKSFEGETRVIISANRQEVAARGKKILERYCDSVADPIHTQNLVVQYFPFPVDGAASASADEPFVGMLCVYSKEEMDSDIARELFAAMFWRYLLAASGFGLMLTGAWWIGSRFGELQAGARRVMNGEYEPVKERWANRELAELTRGFNEMVDQVNHKIQERETELSKANSDLKENQVILKRFIEQVNHDLRSPLSVIGGSTRQLRRFDVSPEQMEWVELIESSAKRIQALAEDIRDHHDILSGRAPLRLGEVDMDGVIRQACREIAERAAANNVTVKVAIEDRLPPLYSDREKLLRILVNLLTNACKFTHNGEVRCNVRTETVLGNVRWCIIEVADSGRGLSPEEQQKLFQPHEKILSKEENPDGTGLGLVICRRLCDELHGSVDVDPARTAKGRGATFVVRLPVSYVSTGETLWPIGSAVQLPQAPGQNVALIIDDDHDVCTVMSDCLSEHGYKVIEAHDGNTGLTLARQHQPNLITLDVQLPELNGWTVLKELKDDASTRDIPVIMVTIFNNPRKGFALGAADFVNKPVDWDYFGTVVDKYRSRPGAGRILIVEDDAAYRKVLASALGERGWEVVQAQHGVEGLEMVRRARPDVILLDLMMPEMDGFDFVAALRSDTGFHDLPVIVLTGKDLTPLEQEWLRGRVEQVIDKQHRSWDELRREIITLLERKSRAAAP